MNVCIYCRVSSEEQADKDISIPAQRKLLRRWAAQQGMTVVQEFLDEGESAYAPANKRPGFMAMMAFCKKNQAKLILVHKLDRFSRNREESILFKGMLRRAGVTVKSISEDYDPETPQGFLYEGMIEVINQFYSMNLATETIKGMSENAERGYHNGGSTPYGYCLEHTTENGRTRGRLVLGPEQEVATVKEIFRLATNEGRGACYIASELNRRGIPAPRTKHWGKETVWNILKNPVYVGDLTWRRRKGVGRGQSKVTDPKEWVVAENAVPAIIERALFEKRKALSASRPFVSRPGQNGHGKYLLSRLIHCGHCSHNFSGKRFTYRTRSGEARVNRHYACCAYLCKGASVCPSNLISVDWAEDAVLGLLRSSVCASDRLTELEHRIQQKLSAVLSGAAREAKTFAKQVQEVERRIANYYKAIGEGMDVAVCRKHIADLTARKVELEAESELAEKEEYYAQALTECVDSMREFAAAFSSDFAQMSDGARRQVVRYFVGRIDVVQRDTFRVTLRIPFDHRGLKLLTEEMEQSHIAEDSRDEDPLTRSALGAYPYGVAGESTDSEHLLNGWIPAFAGMTKKTDRPESPRPLSPFSNPRGFLHPQVASPAQKLYNH